MPNSPRCCIRWKAVRRGCSSTTSTSLPSATSSAATRAAAAAWTRASTCTVTCSLRPQRWPPMRAEDVGARTWLYAGLAGWALCVWILAMFGMGGSIDRLDDDPSLRQALPEPAAPGAQRLGPMAQYGDVAARPLFTDNRRPQPFVIDPMGEAEGASNDFDYVLSSVLRTPALQMVILQPAGGGEPVRVKLGGAPDAAPGWVLQSVAARGAVFAGPEGERSLELRVFDGTGGQAPTPMSSPIAAPGPGGPASAAMADADMAATPRETGGSQPSQKT